MKFNRTLSIRLILGVALITLAGVSAAQEPEPDQANPVGTAITYQGRLDKSGQPVDATCDMTFRLYDRETTGSQAGLTVDGSVAVSEGLFAVSLDFGAGAFDGKARWLEIAVQCPGDAAATTLPRVALTAAPYAQYALSAPWAGLQNIPPDYADGIDNDTQYRAGWGLRQQETAFSVDERLVQARIESACADAQGIRIINQNGTVTCQDVQEPLTVEQPLTLSNGTDLGIDLGSGSGLDADTLDALDSTEYLILAQNQTVTGSPTFGATRPFSVTHDILIPNLNAELLGGKNSAQYFRLDAGEVVSAENKTTFVGQVDFTASPAFNNNPPFTVSGPNRVTDLNADLLDSLDSTAYFKLNEDGQTVSGSTTVEGSLTFNSRPAFNGDDSDAPFTVVSTQTVAGLNADYLDGKDASELTTNDTLDQYFKLDRDGQTVSADGTTFSAGVTFNDRPAFNGGTASQPPFTVDSSILVDGLNADLLDGNEASAFAASGHNHDHGSLTGLGDDDHPQYLKLDKNSQDVSGNNLTFSGSVAFSSQPAFHFGDATHSPFTVNPGTDTVANLDADLLDGYDSTDFAFATDLDAYLKRDQSQDITGQPTFKFGASPFLVDSSTVVLNLNADLLDGQDSSDFLTSANLSDYFRLRDDELVEGDTTFHSATTTTFEGKANFNKDVVFGALANVTFNKQVAFAAANQAPFTVDSTATKVTYLDADLLDGYDSSDLFRLAQSNQTVSGNNTTFGGSVDFDSRPAFDGDNTAAPFTVVSTQTVTNLSADQVDGHDAGNASGNIPISNGTVNTNLNADQVDGHDAGNASGNIPISNGTVNTNLNADLLDGYDSSDLFRLAQSNQTVSGNNTTFGGSVDFDSRPAFDGDNTAAPFTVVSTQTVANLSADLLDGEHGSFYLDAGNLATGTLDNARFSAYDNLSDTNRLDNTDGADLLTRDQSDGRYTRGCYAHRAADWAALDDGDWQSVPDSDCSIPNAGVGALKVDSRTKVGVDVTGTAGQLCQVWIGVGFGTQDPVASEGEIHVVTCIIPSGDSSKTCTETEDITAFKEVTTTNSSRIWVRRFASTAPSCTITVKNAWNVTTFVPQ